ncbi:MAG: sporulation integral membrane protein YtvI [Clostridia bacterium]|nr:sporulation integral membrane protein YtvI [Clostridia bacterium]
MGVFFRVFCAVSVFAAVWLLLRYAGGAVAAVIVLLALSSAVNGGASKISEKTGLPKRLCASVIVILLFSVFGAAVFFAAAKLISELRSLTLWISENRTAILSALGDLLGELDSLTDSIDISVADTKLSEYMGGLGLTLVNKLLSLILGALEKPLSAAVSTAPRALFLGAVFIIAAVWLSVDRDRIAEELAGLLPRGVAERTEKIRKKLGYVAGQYLRAYVILFFITFAEVYIGLLILRAPYALLISFLVSAVDMLPVLGAGAVLVPWAVVSVALGSYGFGIGLLILYGVVTLVRQMTEPHVIGRRFGVHPFISLASALAGYWAFGALGALLAPFCVALFSEMQRENLEKTKKCAKSKKM